MAPCGQRQKVSDTSISSSVYLEYTRRTLTSVNDALVCLMTTLLLLVMVAQIEMASPGT